MNAQLDEKGLRKALAEAGGIVTRQMDAFVFGGGAMVFRNQKQSTKDVDVIFEERGHAAEFAAALRKTGFRKEEKLSPPYELMRASGGIWLRHDSRFDVFAKTVMGSLYLTPTIKQRSTLLEKFGNVRVHLLSNEDVALFKSITDRPKDVDDIAAIVRSTNLDWKVIAGECKQQSGKRSWYGAVYNKLAELKERHGIDAPIQEELYRLDELSILVEAFKRRLQEGKTRAAVLKELRSEGASEEDLKRLNALVPEK